MLSTRQRETRPVEDHPVKQPGERFTSIFTLARWRLRQTWWLLLMANLGFLAAMIIACVVPLFSAVATSAGLQSLLATAPGANIFTLGTSNTGISTQVVHAVQQQTASPVQNFLGPYLGPAPAPMSIQAANFRVLAPASLRKILPVSLYATDLNGLKPHIQLVAGRWPSASSSGVIEALISQPQAQQLHVTVGAQLSVRGNFVAPIGPGGVIDPAVIAAQTLTVRVVGLVQIPPAYQSVLGGGFQAAKTSAATIATLLVPTPSFLSAMDQVAARMHSTTLLTYTTFNLTWHYQLQLDHLRANQLDDLIQRLSNAQETIINLHATGTSNNSSFPYLTGVSFTSSQAQTQSLLSLLRQYDNRMALVNVPISILALQIIALLLFFVCLLMIMLVDRQMAANALLSSRGASSRQIFWSLFLQGIGICLLGTLLGPLAGLALVSMLTLRALPDIGPRLLSLALGGPAQVLLSIAPFAGGTLLIALLALGLLIRYTTGLNMLTLRRETARATRRPFWQRYYLDVLAALIALSGYGVALYTAGVARQLDAQTQDLIIAPLTLIAPLFLLLGCLLLFLRIFPWLLRLGSWSARKARGATTMLAVVQMARSPRQAVRLTLLLSLTIAFAIFAQVFSASQARRASDIAAYETGADFSGTVLDTNLQMKLPLTSVLARYRAIPGVRAASPGFWDQGTVLDNQGEHVNLTFLAVDSQSFARTAHWGPQDSQQSLSSLLAGVSSYSTDDLTGFIMPVIIDESLANQLGAHVRDVITNVSLSSLTTDMLGFTIVAIVPHIPTTNSNTGPGSVASSGGMLADYVALTRFYTQEMRQEFLKRSGTSARPPAIPPVPLNHIWLDTEDDERALASVRHALSVPPLGVSNLYDRRAILADLQSDPLSVDILVILGVGGIAAFLLALVGTLIASWLSVRMRRGGFVVLRALGASARHVAGVLIWEQGIVYLGAIILELAFGIVLTLAAVPTLVFTGLPRHGPMSTMSISDFYTLQHVLPVQIIIPFSLDLIFGALVLICLLALATMIRTALHPSLGSELRVNED
jgi:ABC-type lipoprotein release transport system permease subunit